MNQNKPHVIIIEDEFSLRETLAMLLEELECSVERFDSFKGVESLNPTVSCSAGKNKVLFLVDQNLPDGKGLDFIVQRIKVGECLCGGRCMAIMSGGLTRMELERAEEIGCSILEKPVMFEDLKKWLNSVSA